MTVKEYLVLQECDYDIEDKDYDTSVTCCYIDEITDSYEKFWDLLTSKVHIVKGGDYPVANWSGLVKQNMEKFKEFSKKHWRSAYDNDEDEFLYQWVKEFHCYLAGMVSENNFILDKKEWHRLLFFILLIFFHSYSIKNYVMEDSV